MLNVMIGGQLFDYKCPNNCPGKSEYIGQGGLCHRCPIFNCMGKSHLLDPDNYRKDWAKAWKEWFDAGMIGFPKLKL